MRAITPLYLLASGLVVTAAPQEAPFPDARLAERAACQANCQQPCQQLTQQQISWSQASFATKITAATVLEVYNNVIGETRTIIQYNTEVGDFTTSTVNGVEATYMGEYTVTSANGAGQAPRTTTYVENNGGSPSTVTVTFGTVVSIFPDTISWSGTVPTTIQGTATCLTHDGFDVETLPSMATVTSVQPVASDEGYLGLDEDPYGEFWSPVYNSDVASGEEQTYLAQFYPDVAALSGNTCPVAQGCNLRPRGVPHFKRQGGATTSGTAIVLTSTSSITESQLSTAVIQSEVSGVGPVAVNSSIPLASSTTITSTSSSAVSGSSSSASVITSTSATTSATSTSVSSSTGSFTSTTSQTLLVGQPIPVVFSTVSRSGSLATLSTSPVLLSSSTTTQSAVSAVPVPGGSSTIAVSASTTISSQAPPPLPESMSASATAAAASVVTSAPVLSISPSLLYNGSTATFALTQSSFAVASVTSVFAPGNFTVGSPNATATLPRNATGTRGIVPYTGNAAPGVLKPGHGVVVDSIILMLGGTLGMWLW